MTNDTQISKGGDSLYTRRWIGVRTSNEETGNIRYLSKQYQSTTLYHKYIAYN